MCNYIRLLCCMQKDDRQRAVTIIAFLILFDNSRLYVSFATPPRVWAVGCVGYVNTSKKPTGSDIDCCQIRNCPIYKLCMHGEWLLQPVLGFVLMGAS